MNLVGPTKSILLNSNFHSNPSDCNKGFTTALFFHSLHEKNREHRNNIRGIINHQYNQLLKQNGLNEEIPGGENLEVLGMDQTTAMSRPDLYHQAYREVLARFNDHSPISCCLSTANFFDLLQEQNVKHSKNLRGLINQRYNALLIELGQAEFIPGTNLEALGMDQTTKISHPELYFKAYREVMLEKLQLESFMQGLQKWCEQPCPEGKEARVKAKQKIVECYNRKSQTLDLSYMELTSLPAEIGQLVQLKKLDISSNQLQVLPAEIGLLVQLKKLYISGCQLQALPPEIGLLVQLKELYISSNQLQVLPPEIGLLVQLKDLYIADNQLQALPPEIGLLAQLEELYIADNQLQSLPGCLARLSASCQINVEENRLSYEAVQTFQAQIAQAKATNPLFGPTFHFSIFDRTQLSENSSLDEMVGFWITQFQGNFSKENPNYLELPREMFDLSAFAENAFYQPLCDLRVTEQNNLKTFLMRLKKTQDFMQPSTCQTLVLNVAKMLHGACTSAPFREKLCFLLEDALSTCGDRVANAFNMICLQRELLCGNHPDLKTLASLLIGARRIDMIEGIARKIIQERELGDQIETLLFFKVKLKGAFKDGIPLPVATVGMLYPEMSGVEQEDLDTTLEIVLSKTSSEEQILEILLSSEEWQTKVVEENKDEFESIENEAFNKIEELCQDRTLASVEVQNQIDKVNEAKKEATIAKIRDLTMHWIQTIFLAS